MAVNIGPMLANFSKAELKNFATQAAQGAASALASRQQGMGQQSDLPKSRLMGGIADIPLLSSSITSSIATFPARLGSREAMKGIRMGAGIAANVGGGVEGEAFSAVIGEATAGFQSFVNVLTVPNVANFSTFMEHVSTAPQKIEKFAEALLKSRDELAKFSPEYAIAQAERTVGDIFRQQESAQRTGESALGLTRGLEEIKDALQPIRDDLFNLTSDLIQDLVPHVVEILEQLKDAFPAFKAIAELGVQLFEVMLAAVPWEALQGLLEIFKIIADALNALVETGLAVKEGIAPLLMLEYLPTLYGLLSAIGRQAAKRDEREKQEELKEENARKSHAQDIIKELLKREPGQSGMNSNFTDTQFGSGRG